MTEPSPSSRRPLIVCRDPSLLEELMRLCAAAAATPDLALDTQSIRRRWGVACCVLIGGECADEIASLQLDRRADVLLVSFAPMEPTLWRRAVATRAEGVLVLPQDQSTLIQTLTDCLDGNASAGLTVGTIGARGGAGASTVAAGLGLVAAAAGQAAILVDIDPWGGGVELVVGCEDTPGLRWPEVAATRGRISAQALRSALPAHQGLSVLSCARGVGPSATGDEPIDPSALSSVLDASRRGCDLVVLDLPRRLDPAMTTACQAVDVLLLVTTPDVRSTAGAAWLGPLVRAWCTDVRLVTRVGRGNGLSSEAIADAVDLPLAGEIHTRHAVRRSIDDGLGPLASRRFERQFTRLLDAVRPRAARNR